MTDCGICRSQKLTIIVLHSGSAVRVLAKDPACRMIAQNSGLAGCQVKDMIQQGDRF